MNSEEENDRIESRDLDKIRSLPRLEQVPAIDDLSRRAAQGASDAAVDSLIVVLASSQTDPEVRDAWVSYFGASKSEVFFPLLDEWLNEPDEHLRRKSSP